MKSSQEQLLAIKIRSIFGFNKEFAQSAKRIIEAGNKQLYTLDFLAMSVINRAMSLSKAYVALANEDNFLSAVSLVRLQLDNALRFFAATLVTDSNDFVLHFMSGKEIRDYSDHKGKKMNDSYLAKELDVLFPGTLQLYKTTCGYIHLSDKHFFSTLEKVNKESRTIGIRIGAFDNYTIDQRIDFTQTMLEVSKLVLIIVEQWKHEKNRLHDVKS